MPEKVKIKTQKRLLTIIETGELKIRREKAEKNHHMQSKLHTILWNRVNPIGAPAAATCTAQHEISAEKFSVTARTQRRVGKRNRPRNAEALGIKLQPEATKIGETSSGKCTGFMCPSGVRLEHPMVDLLLNCTEEGCRVDFGEDWSKEKIVAAVKIGQHIKITDADAEKYVWAEAEQKQKD